MGLNKILASILLLSSLSFGQDSEKDEFECSLAINKVDYYLYQSMKNSDSNEYVVIWSYELLRTCDENIPEYKVVKTFIDNVEREEKKWKEKD